MEFSKTRNSWSSRLQWAFSCLLVAGLSGCASYDSLSDFYWNNTFSLVGPATDDNRTAGERGDIQVSFVNETPYRAIFTFGTYDPLNTDQETDVAFEIQFAQFDAGADSAGRLEAYTSTAVLSSPCGRALSIGGEQLVDLIIENELDEDADENALFPLPDPDTDEPHKVAGIAFSDRALDEDGADEPTAGWAESLVMLQGVDYPCDTLIVFTFVEDDNEPGGIRLDVTVVLP